MNARPYLGTPYRDGGRGDEIGPHAPGLDCWGLVVAFYRRELGLELPDYAGAYASAEEAAEVARVIEGGLGEWVRVAQPEPGDVVLLWVREPSQPSHVGVYLEGGWLLNVRAPLARRSGRRAPGPGAVREPLRAGFWSTRVAGYFRHRSRFPTWRLHVMPSPFSMVSRTLDVPVGQTIADGLAEAELARAPGGAVRVLLGDVAIPERVEWNGRELEPFAYLRPRAGDLVVARSLPREPASITAFLVALGTTLGEIGAALAPAALTGAVGSAVGSTTFGLGIGAAFAIEGAAVFATGALFAGAMFAATSALTGLASPSEPSQPKAIGPGASLAAAGVGNELRPFEVIPSGFGHFRAAPPFGAPPYTELVAGARYWRLLLVVGSGRYRLRDPATGRPRIFVGEVPIDELTGAAYEIREGGFIHGGPTDDLYRLEILDQGANETRPAHYWPLDDAAASSSAAPAAGALALTVGGTVTFGELSVVQPRTGAHSRTAARFAGAGRLEAAATFDRGLAFEAWVEAEDLGATDRRCIFTAGKQGESGLRLYHEGRDLILEARAVERRRFGDLAPRYSDVERRFANALPPEGTPALVVLEALAVLLNGAGDGRVAIALSVDAHALARLELGFDPNDADAPGAGWRDTSSTSSRPIPGAGNFGGRAQEDASAWSRWSNSRADWIGGESGSNAWRAGTGAGNGAAAPAATEFSPAAWVTPSGVVAVGQEVDASNAWALGFKGRIQHVALYTSALPAEEERWHYDLGIGAANVATEGAAPRGARYRIYADSVYERQLNIAFPPAPKSEPKGTLSDWTAAKPGATQGVELSVVLEWPTGLWRINENGKDRPTSVGIDIEYRREAETVWRKAADAASFGTSQGRLQYYRQWNPWAGGTIAVADGEIREAFTSELRWHAEPGEYLIRVRRVELENPNNRGGGDTAAFGSNFTLLAVRVAELGAPPLRVDGITTIAVTLPMETTGGSVDRIFVEGERLFRIYDPDDPEADADGWTGYRLTRNAADAALAVLTDPDLTPEPLTADDCDFDAFDQLRATADTFDVYGDFQSNGRDLPNLILKGSFASLSDAGDGRVSVIQDRPGLEPVGLLSPRNARGFRLVKRFHELPHAVRVEFEDAADGFNVSQEIVYDDGFAERADPANGIEAASRFDSVRARGWIERPKVRAYFRKRTVANRVRSIDYSCEVELDSIAWKRGNVVELTHPTALLGEKWGRAIGVERNDAGEVVAFTLDETVQFVAGAFYGFRAQLGDGRMVGGLVVNPGAGESQRVELEVAIAPPEHPDAGLDEGAHVAVGRAGIETILAMIREIRPREADFAADVVLFPYAPQIHDADEGPVDYVPPITRPVSRPELEAPSLPSILSVESDERWLLRTPAGLVTRARVRVIAPTSSRGAPVAVRARARRVGAITAPAVEGRWSDVGDLVAYVEGLSDGATYEFEAQTQTALGRGSRWSAPVVHRVVGKSAPPPDVPDLRLEGDVIRWRYPSDQVPDLAGFEVRYRIGNGSRWAWQSATRAHDGLIRGTEFPVGQLPRAWGLTVYVLAVDVVENRSNAAAVMLLEQGPAPGNVLRRIDELADGWPGTIEGGAVVGLELVANLVGDTVTGTATLDPGGLEVEVAGVDLGEVRDGDLFYFDADGVELGSRIASRDVDADTLELVDAYEGAATSGACTIEPAAWRADDREPAWSDDDSVDAWGTHSGALRYTARTYVPHPTLETGKRLTLDVRHAPATAALDVEYRELGPWPAWGPDDSAPAWRDDDGAPAWQPTTGELGDADGWSLWRPWPGQLEPLRRVPYGFRARIREDRKSDSALQGFAILVDVDDRVAHVDDLVVGPAGVRVPLEEPFNVVRRVRVSVQRAPGFDATGYEVRDKRADGPLIAPTPDGSTGLFDVTLEGY